MVSLEGSQANTISDQDWLEIQKLSGLPDVARKDIEDVILFYRKFAPVEAGSLSPAKLRQSLSKTRDMLSNALKTTRRLPDKNDEYLAFLKTFEKDPQEPAREAADKTIAEATKVFTTLLERFTEAADGVQPGRTGNRNDIIWFTINALNGFLLYHTRKTLNRGKDPSLNPESTGDFAIKIFRLADGKLCRTRILNAIKTQLIPVVPEKRDAIALIMKAVKGIRSTSG